MYLVSKSFEKNVIFHGRNFLKWGSFIYFPEEIFANRWILINFAESILDNNNDNDTDRLGQDKICKFITKNKVIFFRKEKWAIISCLINYLKKVRIKMIWSLASMICYNFSKYTDVILSCGVDFKLKILNSASVAAGYSSDFYNFEAHSLIYLIR